MTTDLAEFLSELKERTATKFASKPIIRDKDADSFDVDQLPKEKPEWHRLKNVVAVVADLKSSTQLDDKRHPGSTASIYDAAIGNMAKTYAELQADFVDIQGDGGFALFWGKLSYERAMCSAITIRTFSGVFTDQLEEKWPKAPSTGFKVGVASGSILARIVGVPRKLNIQEPVWPGKPVNFAAKTAQQGDIDKLVVTASVWDVIKKNDYIRYSCGCVDGVPKDSVSDLWEDFSIRNVADLESTGKSLKSEWCENCGSDFFAKIREGESRRDDISDDLRLKSRNADEDLKDQAGYAQLRAAEQNSFIPADQLPEQ